MGHRTYKVIFDGKNLLPFFKGDIKDSPRQGFMYWSDDGELLAIRALNWKVCFKEQLATGLNVWRQEFTNLRVPKIYNLRTDPFERGDESIFYDKWMADRAFGLVPAQALVGEWLSSFKDFPPRQKPASFNLDAIMEKMTAPKSGVNGWR